MAKAEDRAIMNTLIVSFTVGDTGRGGQIDIDTDFFSVELLAKEIAKCLEFEIKRIKTNA